MRCGWLHGISRDAALGAGSFVLANGAGEALRPGFSALGDWLSIARGGGAGIVVSLTLGAVLTAYGLCLEFGRLRVPATAVVASAAAVAVFDAAGFYQARLDGRIVTRVIVPASVLVAVALACVAFGLPRGRPPVRRGPWRIIATVVLVLAALPLVNIFTFGLTRYERRADVAVVLGARAYADGTPSLALADRVDEAVRAYHAGLARRLIMSGGIDPWSHVSEARVMRERAVRAGVPRAAIELDEAGASTALTAQNVAHLVPTGTSVLVVSHYFHLPRTALLFRRQGLRPFTLPARMSRRLLMEPWYVLREVPASYVAWFLG